MGSKTSGTPTALALCLDGTQIEKDGSITKTNFFDFLEIPLGEYGNLEKKMTPAVAMKFRNHIVRMKMGISAAIPMLCGGPVKCPMGQRCPFKELNEYPLSEPCPLEVAMVNGWTKDYFLKFNITEENVTEISLVNRLVELDLLDYRANIGLSGCRDEEAPTLLKTTVIESEQMSSEQVNLHPLIEAKSKFHNERLKLLEILVGTPREQYKRDQALGKHQASDAAQHMSKMSALIKQMKDKVAEKEVIEEIKMLTDNKDTEEEIQDADWTTDDF